MSSSIPSSSGSTLSDNSNESTSSSSTKSNDSCSFTEKLDDLPENEAMTSKKEKDRPVRRLSIENSGSREKYPNKIDGPLTPMLSNVGELTPISVETGIETNTAEDMEMPTDISAVLFIVDARNSEETKKFNEKIATLVKENEILREQTKKYISALQMLDKDDKSLERALENLDIGVNQHDYKQEANIFEKKLVQVLIFANVLFMLFKYRV